MLETLFERCAAIVLPEIGQEAGGYVLENPTRERRREEVLGQELCRGRACLAAPGLVTARKSRVERRRADAAARNPADREQIGAKAVRAEVPL